MIPARRMEGEPTTETSSSSLSTAASSEASRLLAELCQACGDLAALQLSPEEPERLRAAAPVLARQLQAVVQRLQRLEQLGPPGVDDAELELEAEPTTLAGVRIVVATAPRLADVCFAGVLELNRAAQELARANGDDTLHVAAETALRKLRRAIRAVLDTAQLEGLVPLPDREQLRVLHGQDLEASLAVRRLYAHFRRALRRAEGDTSVAVLTALRYAAGALATLMSSAAYEHTRVSDRQLLRRLQQRLLAWARGDKDVLRGLELLDDVWTSADLLRDINRRQELRAHDAALAQQLLSVEAGAADWWARLQSLFGLDDELDGWLERPDARPSGEALAQLMSLLRALG